MFTLSGQDIINRSTIKAFIKMYAGTDNWHNLDAKKANLGYGLVHYALIRAIKPKSILCVGSKLGFIPALCAMACRDNEYGFVDFVDAAFDYDLGEVEHWGGIGTWKKIDPKKYFGKFGLDTYLRLHVTTTEKFAQKYPKKKWQYMHIDGDHSYEGVSLDFSLFWPRLGNNGILCLHDILTDNFDETLPCGVYQFWQELRKDPTFNTLEIGGQYGLGLVQKDS